MKYRNENLDGLYFFVESSTNSTSVQSALIFEFKNVIKLCKCSEGSGGKEIPIPLKKNLKIVRIFGPKIENKEKCHKLEKYSFLNPKLDDFGNFLDARAIKTQ